MEKEQVPPQYSPPQGGYPQQGFQQQGFPPQGFQQQGYPQQGYPQQGFPPPQYGQPGMPQNPNYVFSTTTMVTPNGTGRPMANPPPDYMGWSIFNLIFGVLFSYIGICVAYIALTNSKQSRFFSQIGDEVMAHSHSQNARNANIGATALNLIGAGAAIGIIVYYTSVLNSLNY